MTCMTWMYFWEQIHACAEAHDSGSCRVRSESTGKPENAPLLSTVTEHQSSPLSSPHGIAFATKNSEAATGSRYSSAPTVNPLQRLHRLFVHMSGACNLVSLL